jgi:hypothetical protein
MEHHTYSDIRTEDTPDSYSEAWDEYISEG